MCCPDPNLDYIQRRDFENRRAWCCFGSFFAICGFVALGFSFVLSHTHPQSTWVPLMVAGIGFIFCGLVFSDAHRFNYFQAFSKIKCCQRNTSVSMDTLNYPVPEYIITISPASYPQQSYFSQSDSNPILINSVSNTPLSQNRIDPPSQKINSLSATSHLSVSKYSQCPPPSQIELSASQHSIDPPSRAMNSLPATPSLSVSKYSNGTAPSQIELSRSHNDDLFVVDLSLPTTPSQSTSKQSYCHSPSQSEIGV